jgi:signal transduction histidine kinase
VSTLRSFSHPGKTDADRTTMEECLDQALIIGQTRIRGRRDVERRCEGKTPVLANRQQIVQVLLNLLLNAVDATEEGGRIVARTFRDGAWAVLEISDEGTGIAPENLERIFESFYTTKPSGKGTGLGLWLSRMIVRAHGGHLRVASEPGKGSTFRMELPCEGPKNEKGGKR